MISAMSNSPGRAPPGMLTLAMKSMEFPAVTGPIATIGFIPISKNVTGHVLIDERSYVSLLAPVLFAVRI